MDTNSPRCSALSNGRPHPLFIEGGPKLAVTLKTRENSGSVRHSNPTARTAMIMCQSRPLEPSRTVRVLLADRPQFRHSEHSERQRLWTNLKFEGRTVRTSHRATHQKRNCLWSFSQPTGRPSTPQERTVRHSLLKPTRDPTRLWSIC